MAFSAATGSRCSSWLFCSRQAVRLQRQTHSASSTARTPHGASPMSDIGKPQEQKLGNRFDAATKSGLEPAEGDAAVESMMKDEVAKGTAIFDRLQGKATHEHSRRDSPRSDLGKPDALKLGGRYDAAKGGQEPVDGVRRRGRTYKDEAQDFPGKSW
eukprot:TRINITY_DN6407_c0_g1_i2.p2 TRINITY_DN6407_c0_g1~~TRINITY_DN6407_c0_g1_i2.p2  ORF type:complete len:157 (+),score=33.75 TRINITY_DN6407_c0_g1_i2:153-623(+)